MFLFSGLYATETRKEIAIIVHFQDKKDDINSLLLVSAFQIDSSTIDGNVEFVHSQYSCNLSSQVSIQFVCPTKSSIIVIVLE